MFDYFSQKSETDFKTDTFKKGTVQRQQVSWVYSECHECTMSKLKQYNKTKYMVNDDNTDALLTIGNIF